MDQPIAFELQIAMLLPRLRRFAHGLCRDSADADDLTQSSVERALRAKRQFKTGTRLDSWLYKIMRNQWIDTLRSRRRREKFEAPPEAAENVGEDPSGSIEATIELKQMMAAMQRLPDDQREVVALILIEGFGYRETAEILEVPMGTVSSRLARGRSALLDMVG